MGEVFWLRLAQFVEAASCRLFGVCRPQHWNNRCAICSREGGGT